MSYIKVDFKYISTELPEYQLLNPLPEDKISDRYKLKQIADDILKCI